jgi:hypothetical protein
MELALVHQRCQRELSRTIVCHPKRQRGASDEVIVTSCRGSLWSSIAILSCRPMPRCAARAIKQIGRPGPTTMA